MKKQLLFLLTTIVSLNCYAQISFEKGYYIDDTNQKTNCLIKNIDWKSNPTEFEYKLSENSENTKGTIKLVKEFGIDNISKYVRKTVMIDRASDYVDNLTKIKNPIFKEEELFLKVLVTGKSNLYEYVDGDLRRYFYSKENSDIEQLIYKRYLIEQESSSTSYDVTIGKNNGFRQQLYTNLKCDNFKMSKFESINYTKSDLVRFFNEYSKCYSADLVNFEQKLDVFSLTIRPRLNYSSLAIQNTLANNLDNDFGSKIGFGLGLEAEYILPFNKKKWAIAVEPTYQSFKADKTTTASNVSGGIVIAEVDYKSIEVPVGVRHYFFLNTDSKIFVNASYIFNFNLDSSINFKRADNSILNNEEIRTSNNFAFGIGYKLKDKYSLEVRHQTSRAVLADYPFWNSDYKTFSIIFGYSLF